MSIIKETEAGIFIRRWGKWYIFLPPHNAVQVKYLTKPLNSKRKD